jgi:hypothetical protein
MSAKKAASGRSALEDAVSRVRNPAVESLGQTRDPTPHPGRPVLRVTLLSDRPTRLEEGDHLPVNVGEPFDEDEVARIVEDPEPGPW